MASDREVLQSLFRKVRQMEAQHNRMVQTYEEFVQACENQPRSITEEIDSIPGRRIFYNLSDRLAFNINDDGTRGQPLTFNVSQDGPYVMTHYPLVAWLPNAPVGATNFGQWSPVASWPLPDQDKANIDRIDLSYELLDGGSQRNFQNEAAAPIFSRPDNMAPLPVPTLFSPNTTIQFIPTFEDIFFSGSPGTPTTGGALVVTLPGYRIVNL